MLAVCKKNVNQTGRVCNVIGDSQTKSLITMLSCHVSGGEYYIYTYRSFIADHSIDFRH